MHDALVESVEYMQLSDRELLKPAEKEGINLQRYTIR